MQWYDDFAPKPKPEAPAEPDLSDFEAGAAFHEDFKADDFAPPVPEAPQDSAKMPPPFSLDGIDLLTPPGMVGDVAAWIDSQCRYPRRRLAVASAIVTVGNIGGMTHFDARDGVTANMLAFCVAASATGKEAVQQAMAELHRAAGLNYAVQGGIKSEQEITRNLIEHQAAFYIIDEIGIFLNKVRNAQKRGGASYLEGVFGLIMSAYSKANSRLLLNGDTRRELRKIYQAQAAAANKRAEESGEAGPDAAEVAQAIRMLEMIDNGLEKPFLSLVGYTTPSTFDSVMDGEAATQGFIGRSIIVSERDINPEARIGFVKRELPLGLAMRVAQLFPPGMSDDTRGKGRIEWAGDQMPVVTDPEADAMLLQVTHWLHRYADDMGEETGEASVAMVRRAFEMIAKISFILAIPSRVRTADHVRWAFAYVRQELDAKIALVFANDRGRDRPEDAMAARLLGYLDAEKGVSVSVLANRMKAQPATIEPLLARMEVAGMARRMPGRKYRGKVVEVWMAAQK